MWRVLQNLEQGVFSYTERASNLANYCLENKPREVARRVADGDNNQRNKIIALREPYPELPPKNLFTSQNRHLYLTFNTQENYKSTYNSQSKTITRKPNYRPQKKFQRPNQTVRRRSAQANEKNKTNILTTPAQPSDREEKDLETDCLLVEIFNGNACTITLFNHRKLTCRD